MSFGLGDDDYMKITRPYIAWLEKKEVSMPVVAALIAWDSWQKIADDFEVELII